MKKMLLIIAGLIIVLGLLITYYLFSKKFEDMSGVKPDYEVNASDFLKEFQVNDSVANSKYTEKIVLVNGTVSDLEVADSTINIKMADEQSGSYIIFSFQKNEENLLKNIQSGEMISIKGSCSGAIYSDILSAYSITFKRCILINQKK